MGKNPAFQFYPADFDRDTRMLSLESKGAWITFLCAMHWKKLRGRIISDIQGHSRFLGTDIKTTERILYELKDNDICEIVTDGNKKITLINRRMEADEMLKKSNRYRQATFRKRQSNDSNRAVVSGFKPQVF